MRTNLLSWADGLKSMAVLVWAFAGISSAASLEVNPVRVELGTGARGVVVTVKNQSTEPTRFQASAHTWVQDEEGRMTLAPTQEVFFFPAMLSLEPGESRLIRVGVSSAPQDKERSFRLVVEELPPLEPAVSAMGLRILTRVSIPVFVAPKRKEILGRVEKIELRESKFRFQVANAGTVNFFIRQTRVRGLDAQGKRLVEREQPGWYVLAGDKQVFTLDVPADMCGQVRSVEVEAETDRGVIHQSAPVTASVPCEAAPQP
ncbi:molecular chaperone [Corallococcus sp. Z5C101001]|uniref:fimbrial biogenesis chaperone n=2 Tax=Corallococcus TaxID=83461 RepID=UPI00117F5C13|nr:fimbria/pilus periplasmic chaperone [Corallococcus sp. Z5C101001]NBD07935.1 fimbria/pilus periplasmic chaperone [Corallococcus silvisoli]TSC33917.1 fimbria/pilus periplasmic chaperone [Corallococcus sp. Z5C101001]